MNRNIPHVFLIFSFLFRVLFPVTNAIYFFSELTLSRSGLWTAIYIVTLLLEVGATVILVMGIHDPLPRRVGAYIAFLLPGAHYAATLLPFIILPAARRFLGPVFMVALTVVYAFTAAMAYLTLRSVDEMETADRNDLPSGEIDVHAEALRDKLNNTP
ncbi:MAG: hypothetical protein IJD38_00950 [Clostridia bacterium]|nr:hypothetical protein [Clostridia bacterium]